MTRVEIEELIGPPSVDHVQAVTISDGQMRYRTAYEIDDLGPPMTVRPFASHRRSRTPAPQTPRSMIALEFDASQPGHPLIEIVYPDPLF